MKNDRLIALDGLRGVAAIAVALRHAKLPGLPFGHGDLAVDLFFLLSGFVIAKSYEPQLASGRMNLPRYAVVRMERLYPMLFAGAVIGVAMWLAGVSVIELNGGGMVARALVSQFLLVPFLVPGCFFAFNGAHWSIFFELVANFAHAAALPRLTNRVLAGIVGLSAAGLALGAHRFGGLDIGWTTASFLWALPRVGFGFFGGVLLFRTREKWRGAVPKFTLLLPALVLLAVADAPVGLGHGGGHGGWQGALFDWLAVVLVFPPLVMIATEAQAAGLAAALGTLSFPLYAIHKPIVEALWRFHLGWWEQAGTLAVLLAVSWALGRWVDEPLNAWRRQRRQLTRRDRGLAATQH